MFCDEDLLEAYALGLTSEEEAREVRIHLTGCPACAAALTKARRDVAALESALPAPTAPLPDFDAILRSVEERPRERYALLRGAFPKGQRVGAFTAALAAAAALALTIRSGGLTAPTIHPIEPLSPSELGVSPTTNGDESPDSLMSRVVEAPRRAQSRGAVSFADESPTCSEHDGVSLACGAEVDSLVTRAPVATSVDDVCQEGH